MIVALTGFMLCGKSSYGRAAAKRLGVRFVDLDEQIRPGSDPAEIISSVGIGVFREAESKALLEVLNQSEESGSDTLLALGGGAVLCERNRALLKEKSRVVWIKASLEESVFAPEWADEAARRPLLQNCQKSDIEKLWQQRMPVYEGVSDYTVDTAGKTADEVLEDILAILDVLYA